MAARIVPPWNSPPGSIRADPENVDADHDPHRRQQPREEGQHTVRVRLYPRPRPAAPEPVRRQRPHAEQREHQHHLLQQRVDGAVGIRTPVTALPSPVAGRLATASGASVGAGSDGIARRPRAPADIAAHSTAAATRSAAPGRSAAAAASAPRSRAAAPISSTPVTPLPTAASVSATSTAARRTQTIATSSP